jgi:hypothetical protein
VLTPPGTNPTTTARSWAKATELEARTAGGDYAAGGFLPGGEADGQGTDPHYGEDAQGDDAGRVIKTGRPYEMTTPCANIEPNTRRGDAPAAAPIDWALAYCAAALSVIPIRRDGSKAPQLSTWDTFTRERPTPDELQHWFDREKSPGIAIVGGAVSGNLLIVDFEFPDFFDEWRALVEAVSPGLNRTSAKAERYAAISYTAVSNGNTL